MGSSELLQLAIIGSYFAATVLYLVGSFARGRGFRRWGGYLALAAFALHTSALVWLLKDQSMATISKPYFIKLLSWSIVFVSFVLWWRLKLDFLALTTSPLALVLFVSSLTLDDVQAKLPTAWSGLFFGMHIAALFLSIAFLAMAFGAGLAFLRLDRKIKSKERLEGFQKNLPALSTFDRVNQWAIYAGFPLFTLGLLSGFVWARFTWGKVISWDPKEMASIGIWFVFAFLFHQRAMGWRGRKPATLAVWVFVLMVLSLVGINFFLPTHHSLLS